MKTFRIAVVVLLILLLPIRGAVAAAMLCEFGMQMAGSTMAMQSSDPVLPGEQVASYRDVQQGSQDDSSASTSMASANAAVGQATSGMLGAQLCSLCVGGCSSAALVSNLTFALPHALNPAPFPSLTAAPPSFIPEGLERPPRSI